MISDNFFALVAKRFSSELFPIFSSESRVVLEITYESKRCACHFCEKEILDRHTSILTMSDLRNGSNSNMARINEFGVDVSLLSSWPRRKTTLTQLSPQHLEYTSKLS